MSPSESQRRELLAADADRLARAGRIPEATDRFRALLALDPMHVGALSFLGLVAFQQGQLEESAALIQKALTADPDAATLHMNLALIRRRGGELEASRQSLAKAARLEPANPLIRLHNGSVLAALGQLEAAAEEFSTALALAPDLAANRRLEDLPGELRELLQEARTVRQRHLHQCHHDILAPLRASHGAGALERIERFLRVHHGEVPVAYEHPLQRPNYIYIPGLPPQPWFEREDFDWIRSVEDSSSDVRDELMAALEQTDSLRPYVDASTGAPKEWDHLTDKQTWSSFHLLKGGEQVSENAAVCPRTMAMLEQTPLARCQGNSPEAFFSILKPGIEIPPHVGLANFKLAVHLALIIPDGCAIEVGGERRGWEEGRCLIFDDSFEHSAWNHGSRDRAVLIFEVWNPFLTAVEREAIAGIICTSDEFHRQLAVQAPL